MTRLTILFIVTTLIGAVTSILLGCAVIQEAARSSIYSRQSYKNGLVDGEQFARDQIKRAEAMAELLEESKAHKLTLKPL